MKRLLLGFVLLGLVSCESDNTSNQLFDENPSDNNQDTEQPSITIACVPESLQNNVIALYNFSQGSLLDGSTNNHTLIEIDGAVATGVDRSGNANCALEFDGTTQLQMTNMSDLQQATTYSFSVWFNPSVDFMGQEQFTRYIVKGRSFQYWWTQPDNFRESFAIYQSDYMILNTFNGNNLIGEHIWGNDYEPKLAGTWRHVVVNFDSTNNIYECYIDGVQMYSLNPLTGYNEVFNDLDTIFIGERFYGTIDDMFIFDRILTPQEVSQMYNLQPCCN